MADSQAYTTNDPDRKDQFILHIMGHTGPHGFYPKSAAGESEALKDVKRDFDLDTIDFRHTKA